MHAVPHVMEFSKNRFDSAPYNRRESVRGRGGGRAGEEGPPVSPFSNLAEQIFLE